MLFTVAKTIHWYSHLHYKRQNLLFLTNFTAILLPHCHIFVTVPHILISISISLLYLFPTTMRLFHYDTIIHYFTNTSNTSNTIYPRSTRSLVPEFCCSPYTSFTHFRCCSITCSLHKLFLYIYTSLYTFFTASYIVHVFFCADVCAYLCTLVFSSWFPLYFVFQLIRFLFFFLRYKWWRRGRQNAISWSLRNTDSIRIERRDVLLARETACLLSLNSLKTLCSWLLFIFLLPLYMKAEV